nr:uncharacterized protein At4g15545-like isoform X1 [Coffea arabica]XP_027064844.1 uncharacterized protein At4g15545-like isoform X1 [Coffea arabica]
MSSSEGGRGSPDFYLPDEILSVIPTDPYDQLDLARKITSMAIASRVTKLESELGRLRQKLYDKDRLVVDLEDKLSQLQHAYQETDLRLKIALDNNMKLTKERDSLALAAKKLSRDLAKLETFKRQLMQSLNDDNSSVSFLTSLPARIFVVYFVCNFYITFHVVSCYKSLRAHPYQQADTVDIGTYDQSVPKACPAKDEEVNGYTTQHYSSSGTDTASISDDASKQSGLKFSMTPYLSPRLTPTATPKIVSASVSPGRYSAAGSPQKTSGATSPTKSQYEMRGSLSSWYPSSQQSSAANSPPRGRPMPARTPRIDGKEFFRQARSRLSYEQFSAFLANIKELNAQKQSREETLRKAEQIFGMDNKDLYLSFQGLLNRNVH